MSKITRRDMVRQTAFSLAGHSLLRASTPSLFTVVADGKSDYVILLSPDASASERHASIELQTFLEAISGARLPITTDSRKIVQRAILLGQSQALQQLPAKIDFNAFGKEGFQLKTIGSHLIITGGRERGTLYGTYAFLEKLGCRWFAADVSSIPKMRTVTIPPLNEIQQPAFEYREVNCYEASDAVWAARNRLNGVHRAPLDSSVGGGFEFYPFVHTFAMLVPPERYYSSHPEYFSLVDGVRSITRDKSQLCLTNPEVLKISTAAVLQWIKERPEAAVYSVSQNDGTGWCECDNCRRVEQEEGGAHSGPLLRFVNAISVVVEKQHPGKLIDTLAYLYTETPPLKARPRQNVRIRLCPIGACNAHPYETCPHDAYFVKNLQAWSKITDRLYIWHYGTNFSNYLLPMPDFDQLAANIPMYQRSGVVGIYLEGSLSPGGGSDNAALRSYIAAKLMWNPKTDTKRAIDEFHEAYYGPAAKPMRAYFDLLHQQVRPAPSGHGFHAWIYDRADAPYLNDAFFTKAMPLLHQAEAASPSRPIRQRVIQTRLTLDYARLARAKAFTISNGSYQPRDLAALKRGWSKFVSDANAAGVTDMREHVSLDQATAGFERWVHPYAVATLENKNLRVDMVPELEGRIARLIHAPTGKDRLLRPNPGSLQLEYPDMGGLIIAAQGDYNTTTPWPIRWEVTKHAPAEITMSGTTRNGLRLERILRVFGTTLYTVTSLVNPGAGPIPALLMTHLDVDAGDMKGAKVVFTNQHGQKTEKLLIQPGQEPSGNQTYSGLEQPNQRWSILSGTGVPLIANNFVNNQVSRCYTSWTLKSENRIGITIFSAYRPLRAGDKIILESSYSL